MRAQDGHAVYLASASPRRRELLAQIGIRCEIVPTDVEERERPGEEARVYVLRLALAKARWARQQLGDRPGVVVAADTAVHAGGRILGKPRDLADCQRMFSRYSAGGHEVLTAVAVMSRQGESTAISHSEVHFRHVEPAEVEAYWKSGEPVDKAGGYAIQGLGAIFIRSLHGSYSGVMGLPLFETAGLLAAHGIRVPAGMEIRHDG